MKIQHFKQPEQVNIKNWTNVILGSFKGRSMIIQNDCAQVIWLRENIGFNNYEFWADMQTDPSPIDIDYYIAFKLEIDAVAFKLTWM
jgi:hypothetical protein